MYISRFQVANYKSFREPTPLEFTQGFNIVSGQNNAGKTALLEALGLRFTGHPHRSMKTVPARDTVPPQLSVADVSFTLSPKELTELMRASPGTYFVPKPNIGSEFAQKIGFVDDSIASAQRLVQALFSRDQLTFRIRFQAVSTNSSPGADVVEVPSYGLYQAQGGINAWHCVTFEVHSSGLIKPVGSQQAGSDMGHQLASTFQRHVYRFSAERLKVGRSPHGPYPLLQQDASNLPQVLSLLQHNPSRFRELNKRLIAILPQVRHVSVRPIDQTQVEIVVWCHDPETQREDLVVPLAESGTGIGQVLAILYVVMTSERPQTIIIDEPQSFLHPGAVRKLIEFLKFYPQHQFIIATHSAAIIAATSPKTITLARFEDGESTLQQLDAVAEKGIQVTLAELGIRLSDSFGADSILWVEGRTEEKCFPLIVEKILGRSLMGTEILGIRQTGDLQGRDAKRVFEIYRSLAKGASLLPPAIAFILDEECRDESSKRELFKLSGGLAVFLPRRMYENYLLNPRAITEVANGIAGFRTAPLTPEEVHEAIEAKLKDPAYFCTAEKMKVATDRIRNVDAGRVLEELFTHFSETRITYQKVAHGVALTEWLIKNARNDFKEIAELLSKVLAIGDTTSSTTAIQAAAPATVPRAVD